MRENISPAGGSRQTRRSRHAWRLALLLLAGCRSHGVPAPVPAVPAPAALLGRFIDDYDNRFTITASDWIQDPHGHFHIVRWNPAGRYLVAWNDSANHFAPGRWTRIDWVELTGMPPWDWAFCLSAYDAPTQASAEATTIARADTPRTGCNGFPFSRMRRAASGK